MILNILFPYQDVKKIFFHIATQMVKKSSRNVGDLGLIPGSGKSPGEGKGNPL